MATLKQLLDTPDGSMPQLNIANILDGVDQKERDQLLHQIAAKIEYEGFLEITGTDLNELCRAKHQGHVTLVDCNELLFNGRRSVSTIDITKNILESIGFEIQHQRINKYMYYIKAKRCKK